MREATGPPRIHFATRRAQVPKAGLKFHVTALVCQVTGGPQTYSGRSMKWDAMVHDFVEVLDQFKVPKAEQAELLTIVGSTKDDIVMQQSAATARP